MKKIALRIKKILHRRSAIEDVPPEIWIKIARHLADLGPAGIGRRYHYRQIGYEIVECFGSDIPSVWTLRATSRFFSNICVPLCYEYIVWSRKFDGTISALADKLKFTRSLKCTEQELYQATLLPSLLNLTFNLRYFEFYCYEFTPALSRMVFSLPLLAHLNLTSTVFEGDYDGDHLLSSNLTTLTLGCPSSLWHPLNAQPLMDVLYRLPKFSSLVIPYPTAESIFDGFLSRPAPRLQALIAKGTFDQSGDQSFQRYVEQCCSDLRELNVILEPRRAVAVLRQYLPNLRVFRGPLAVATSCISESIEELVLTYPSSMKDVLNSLTSIFTSPFSLRQLEMEVTFVDPALLKDILVSFPNLNCLKFSSASSRDFMNVPVQYFLRQFPEGYHPSFHNLTEFAFMHMTNQECTRERTTEYASWQRPIIQMWGRDNPLLSEVEFYFVLWARHGHHDSDWGSARRQPKWS